MANILSWNIRGLNWPNKQEDMKLFLHKNNIDSVGLPETKVKLHKVDTIAANIFPGWRWHHNFHLNPKGGTWIAWQPRQYNVNILSTTDQLTHCQATKLAKRISFHVTFVYEMNKEQQRLPL